jgi:GxxExxY protein
MFTFSMASKITQQYIEEVTYQVLASASEVQKTLGVGLIKDIYLECMIYELKERGFDLKVNHSVPLVYKKKTLKSPITCDLLVENHVVVELHAVEVLSSLYDAHVLSCMRLLEATKGILINFNSANIQQEGSKKFTNELYMKLPRR